MRLNLLGTFEGRHHDVAVALGRRQERCLLGVLALEVGRPLSIDRLVDLLWDVNPPASARAAIHTYVARLRHRLSPYGVRILTRHDRYQVPIGDVEVDAHEFADLITSADSTVDAAGRAAGYRRALDLWRGELMADVAGDDLRYRLSGRLLELRWQAIEGRMDALLELGRAEAVIAEFSDEIAANPGRERMVGYGVTACYRMNRQADALGLYESTRAYLAEELGVDPGAELRNLYAQILRQSLDLAVTGRADRSGARGRVPRQLPHDLPDFVGRAADLRALDEIVEPGATIAISAIGGMSGVGKTALAVRWAHRVAELFPDGQLYLNLLGYDETPMPAVEALGRLIRALGHSGADIPDDEQEAAALYRTLVAGKRMLVLLDNSRSVEQVRPLLPGSSASTVLVTSRDTLSGLVARDGARLHVVDVLAPAESLELLRRMLGPHRVDSQVQAATSLMALVGHLPLALRILAAQLAAAPRLPIADLLASVTAGMLLDHLAVGDDPQASVRIAFDSSYRTLGPDQQQLFGLIGSAPGSDITAAACAAMLDRTVQDISDLLLDLTTAHLVTERSGRFAMHDLVRDYARQRVATDDPAWVATALARLRDWYVGHARAAATTLFPGACLLPWSGPAVEETSEAGARAFLDTEVANIVATIRCTDPRHVCLLAETLRSYFWLSDHPVNSWVDVATRALGCAEQLDDQARASAHLGLASANKAASAADALSHARKAAHLAAGCGWWQLEVTALSDAAQSLQQLGRYGESAELFDRAARTNLGAGRTASACANLHNAAISLMRLGRLAEAVDTAQQSIALGRDHMPSWFPPLAGQNLAILENLVGDRDAALARITGVIEQYTARGEDDSDSQGRAYDTLAAIQRDAGRLELALAASTHAIDLMLRHGPAAAANAFNTRGSILYALGRVDEAADHHRRALSNAGPQHGAPWLDALLGTAHVELARGNTAAVREQVDQVLAVAREGRLLLVECQALTLLAEAALSEADTVRAARHAGDALRIHRETGYARGVAQAENVLAAAYGDVAQTIRTRATSVSSD